MTRPSDHYPRRCGCEVTATIEPTPAISWDAVALAVMLNVAPADLAEALTTLDEEATA